MMGILLHETKNTSYNSRYFGKLYLLIPNKTKNFVNVKYSISFDDSKLNSKTIKSRIQSCFEISNTSFELDGRNYKLVRFPHDEKGTLQSYLRIAEPYVFYYSDYLDKTNLEEQLFIDITAKPGDQWSLHHFGNEGLSSFDVSLDKRYFDSIIGDTVYVYSIDNYRYSISDHEVLQLKSFSYSTKNYFTEFVYQIKDAEVVLNATDIE